MKNLSDSEKWKLLFKSDVRQAAEDLCRQPSSETNETAETLGAAYMVNVVLELQSDTAADLLRHLPSDFRERVLNELPKTKEAFIREILSYEPGTAGSIMAKEYLAVGHQVTVGDTIRYLRGVPPDQKGKVSYIYALDSADRLEGVIQARDLVFYPEDKPVSDILRKPIVQVETGMSQMAVAKLLQRHRYLGLPVVNTQQKLVGIVSADRAMHALEAEATDDIAKMVGTSAEEMQADSVHRIIRLRLPWLSVNIAGGLLCALILGIFENSSMDIASLFLFIPVVLGVSESMGVQSATIVVRNLTLGRSSFKQLSALLVREFAAGTLIGSICGVVVGLCSWFWKHDASLGFAIAGSLIPAIWISAIIGLGLPLLFRRFKADPAIASGPLTLALCDVQTLFVYFYFAGLILKFTA